MRRIRRLEMGGLDMMAEAIALFAEEAIANLANEGWIGRVEDDLTKRTEYGGREGQHWD